MREVDANDFASFDNDDRIVKKLTDCEMINEVKENPETSKLEKKKKKNTFTKYAKSLRYAGDNLEIFSVK